MEMHIFRVQIGEWAFIRAWAFSRDFTVYKVFAAMKSHNKAYACLPSDIFAH